MPVRICVLLWALMLAACGGGGAASPPDTAAPTPGTAATGLSGQLTVFAAASLTDAFEDIAARFQAAHPDVEVAFNFGGSATLATQITESAPADVFASANQTQMDVVEDAGLVERRRAFAGNRLEIAVEPGNPLAIAGLEDLARSDVTLVLAAEEVPAGQYARQALDAQGITVDPASLETDVRAVLSRVALGEADAGIVYASDIVAADGGVDGVTVPPDHSVAVTYPIAPLTSATNPAAARAFVEEVVSADGRDILAAHGFTAP